MQNDTEESSATRKNTAWVRNTRVQLHRLLHNAKDIVEQKIAAAQHINRKHITAQYNTTQFTPQH